MTVESQLSKFLDDASVLPDSKFHPAYSRWLEDPGLTIYVRRATRFLDNQMLITFDIASVEAKPAGRGRFTKFLTLIEKIKPFEAVFVENVSVPRFQAFFLKRDYEEKIGPASYIRVNSYYKIWDKNEQG